MNTSINIDPDVELMKEWRRKQMDTESVSNFIPGPGIQRLNVKFDIKLLREALDECLQREAYKGNMQDKGFSALPLTQRPGQTKWDSNDLSGRYWLRADDRYIEEPREDLVDESLFSEFCPKFSGTYFEYVHQELIKRFPIGRMRVLSKGSYTHSDRD
jgi:hypothetical protein